MTHQKTGVWIHGSSGRMGKELQKAIIETTEDFRLIGGSTEKFEGELFQQGKGVTPELLGHTLLRSEVKLVLDFTSPEGNALLLDAVRREGVTEKAFVIGTTGLSSAGIEPWKDVAKKQRLAVLVAPNTSIGVLLLARTALTAAGVCAPLGYDIEIVETHHRMKKDAPSGTAKFLADTIVAGVKGLRTIFGRGSVQREPGEIGMHAVRGGGVFGEHEVRIIGDGEELTLAHRAFSRRLFASGALVLARWLLTKEPGFYELLDISVAELAKLKTPSAAGRQET